MWTCRRAERWKASHAPSLKNEAPKPFELRWWAHGLDGVDLADRNTADVMSRAGRTELRESPDEKGDDQDNCDKGLATAELQCNEHQLHSNDPPSDSGTPKIL